MDGEERDLDIFIGGEYRCELKKYVLDLAVVAEGEESVLFRRDGCDM